MRQEFEQEYLQLGLKIAYYRKLRGLTQEELADQKIKPNPIRLSIGTEHIDDILADLQRGFDAVKEE